MMNGDNRSDFLMSFFETAAYGMDVSKKMTIEEAIEIMTVGSDMNMEHRGRVYLLILWRENTCR